MSLYLDIMSLVPRRHAGQPLGFSPAYLDGFGDARHAAAELALNANATRDQLLDALKAIVALDDGDNPALWPLQPEFDAARAAIAAAEDKP